MDFLYLHRIEDKETLQSKKDELLSELKHLIVERRKLNTAKERAVREHNVPGINQAKSDISAISRKIREIRKEIKLCDAVTISSDRIMECADIPAKPPEIETPKPQIKDKNQHLR